MVQYLYIKSDIKTIGESPPIRDGSVITGERQRGACNQGKEVLKFLLRQFGHTPCPLQLKIITVMFSYKKTLETHMYQGFIKIFRLNNLKIYKFRKGVKITIIDRNFGFTGKT